MSSVLSNCVRCLLRAAYVHLNVVQTILYAVQLLILLLQPLQDRPPHLFRLSRLLLCPRQTELQSMRRHTRAYQEAKRNEYDSSDT